MPSIDKVKDIVVAAAISVPIFFFGGKLIRMIRDEISPQDDDEDFIFDDDD